ncbi:MAG: hypothetical protein AAF763_19230 [Pseudomonadota bacterium]
MTLTETFAELTFVMSPEEALILIGLAGAAAGLGKAAADALRGDREEEERIPIRIRPDDRPRPPRRPEDDSA